MNGVVGVVAILLFALAVGNAGQSGAHWGPVAGVQASVPAVQTTGEVPTKLLPVAHVYVTGVGGVYVAWMGLNVPVPEDNGGGLMHTAWHAGAVAILHTPFAPHVDVIDDCGITFSLLAQEYVIVAPKPYVAAEGAAARLAVSGGVPQAA